MSPRFRDWQFLRRWRGKEYLAEKHVAQKGETAVNVCVVLSDLETSLMECSLRSKHILEGGKDFCCFSLLEENE